MHGELTFPVSTILSFLGVLARMLGVFVFVPLPLKDAGPSLPRIAWALGATLALYTRWPVLQLNSVTFTTMLALVIPDALLGIAIGLLVAFLAEALTLGAQSLALQAGYGYASVVDPTNQADSDVLAVMAQLLAGLFFFTMGLHRYVIRALADSLGRCPPGSFVLRQGLAKQVLSEAGGAFAVGLRLALPVIGLMLTAELTLALLGRINPQLHLGIQAFPVKMLLALACLSAVLVVTPNLYSAYAEQLFRTIGRSVLR